MRRNFITLISFLRINLQSTGKQMSRNRRRFTLVTPSLREVPRAQPTMETRSTKRIIPMCLSSICRGSTRTDRDLDNRVNAFTNGTILKARVARAQAIFKWHQFLRNCSLYLPATWMQAFPLARRRSRPYWQIATASFYNPLSG